MIFFGKNCRFLRELYKLQQAEMPDFIGVSRSTWSEYEREKVECSFETLIKIARFFGISVDILLKHDISTDVSLIEKLKERVINKNVALNVSPNVSLNHKEFEDFILNDDGGQYSNSMLKKLMQQIAEMRKDINELKTGKK